MHLNSVAPLKPLSSSPCSIQKLSLPLLHIIMSCLQVDDHVNVMGVNRVFRDLANDPKYRNYRLTFCKLMKRILFFATQELFYHPNDNFFERSLIGVYEQESDRSPHLRLTIKECRVGRTSDLNCITSKLFIITEKRKKPTLLFNEPPAIAEFVGVSGVTFIYRSYNESLRAFSEEYQRVVHKVLVLVNERTARKRSEREGQANKGSSCVVS